MASLNWVFFQKLERDFFVVTVDNLSLKEALEKSSAQMDLDTVSLNIVKLTFNSKSPIKTNLLGDTES